MQVHRMKNDVRIQKEGRQETASETKIKLTKELRDCMNCRYFHGNNSQCIRTGCIACPKEKPEIDVTHACYQCRFSKPEGYCFPCLRKMMGEIPDKQSSR